jgi:hypothetical protein
MCLVLLCRASTVSGTAGTLTGSVRGATLELDEALVDDVRSGYTGSVWFKWLVPAGAGTTLKLRVESLALVVSQVGVQVLIDAAGTLLSLDDDVDELAFDAPGCPFSDSQCRTFVVTRGQAYAIRVFGDATATSGPFSVRWATTA